jgi:rfaE bifunctional protein kinase chain/domain
MVNLSAALSGLKPKKVLVIGDIVLDTYTIGKAKRISPEAPVAVVNPYKMENRPGMAGNVALNVVALGASVSLLARIGDDAIGVTLRDLLKSEGIDTSSLVVEKGFHTHSKNRIIADQQQIVRVDHEVIAPLSELAEEKIISDLPVILEGVDAVAISDYGKGFLTISLLSSIIEKAKERGIPVIADPKGLDFTRYAGVTLIKPNYGEAILAANLGEGAPLDAVAKKILSAAQSEMLLITRSSEGATLFDHGGNRYDYPVVDVREVADVTGAGDTVLAMLSVCIANRMSMETAIPLCNVAGGISVERFGCAQVTLGDIAHRLLRFDDSCKVFNEEHLFALQKVLGDKKAIVLTVTLEEGITKQLYQRIQGAVRENHALIVYVRDETPDPLMVELLSSVRYIDAIFICSKSLGKFCELLEPEMVLSQD